MRTLLKQARLEKKFTQADVAKKLHVTTNHYQAIELGVSLGSIALWDKLEDLFNTPQRQLRKISPPETLPEHSVSHGVS